MSDRQYDKHIDRYLEALLVILQAIGFNLLGHINFLGANVAIHVVRVLCVCVCVNIQVKDDSRLKGLISHLPPSLYICITTRKKNKHYCAASKYFHSSPLELHFPFSPFTSPLSS